ncbi:uncharacterized protein LOC117238962 [Bombus vosnesenskii]|uniref:Uncharacterized protein LOC117238962 n=1 Tax=Bombus vosnesenskii TaxID=207650 RepID=A0A6J3L7X5_9HYME|nr:uncharacterized protein LOC117238962 [Bombus vosnesenskii]
MDPELSGQERDVTLVGENYAARKSLPRPPRCAAVSLTVSSTYRDAMSVVKREVKLSELDKTESRLRRAITGALLFEISGQETESKASRLAERMAATLKDLPAKVTVPRRTAELRVTGLEDSVTSEEVTAAIAEAGGCHADEVNVGVIRSAPRGLGSVWLRCPLTTASKISRGGDARPGGRINIGWSASLTERRIGLAAVAEPYSIPDASRGAGDLIGLVTIFWTGIAVTPPAW